MNFLCTLNLRLSKVSKLRKQDKEAHMNKGQKNEDKDSKKGSLIGGSQRPHSCPSPCLVLCILHSSASSLPPSASKSELSSREVGMKRLRENYTKSFSLTRQGK